MIRIQHKLFRGDFLPTFDKLCNTTGLNQRVAYNISKLAPKIKKAASGAQEEFIALVNHWAIKDEKGVLVPMKDQPGTYQISPENTEAWKKAVIEFENKEVTIDRAPLMVGDLAQATLTPNDYLALEPIIFEMGLAPEAKEVAEATAPQGA